LESQSAISQLQHGIQVRSGKETLGELDFLFYQESRLFHLEVALKFYLCYPEGAENGSQFVGPNASDSFERKRDRLLGKQLPFGREFYPEIERSLHAVKGMIFYHRYDENRAGLPDRLNPDHARGEWLRKRELERFFSEWSVETGARILRKPFWLSPSGPLLTLDEVARSAEEHFKQWGGPIFLALSSEGKRPVRVFVMPDFWPAKSG
ncbi:MAG: DUF1853 family protein, partial [Verrucomicrobiota bacterium]